MSGPGRPQNLQLLTLAVYGSPVYLGQLIVTNLIARNNATTTVPFYYQPRGGTPAAGSSINYEGTLAGKSLLLQAMDDAFYVMPATTAVDVAITGPTGANPGLRVGVGERFNWVCGQTEGWIKSLAETATATINVWEIQP